MMKVTLTRANIQGVDENRFLSLGEYYKVGSPQQAVGARRAFLKALQLNHQEVLREIHRLVLAQARELEYEVFEELVYSIARGRALKGGRILLQRGFSNPEEEACRRLLGVLEAVLSRFNLNVQWMQEQALVTVLNWLPDPAQPPTDGDLEPDFPTEQGQHSWVRLPITWTLGSGDSRHEWPAEIGDFRFWLAQKPPDPEWAESQGVEMADDYAWDPVWESREDFETRAVRQFQSRLSDYIHTLSRHVEAAGYVRAGTKKRRLFEHMEWLSRYQVTRETWQKVADHFGQQLQTIKDEMKGLRELLQLPKRGARKK